MRIALIGAAGSGKTEIAEALAKEFNLKVIDGYAEAWSERTGMVVGFSAGYPHSLSVALDRVFLEAKEEDDFVTCGTSIDSLMYMAMASLKTPNQIEFARAKAYMEIIGTLFYDFWNYDHVFMCRMPEGKAPLPEKEETAKELLENYEFNNSVKFDLELKDTVKSFMNVDYFELPSKDGSKDAIKKIKESIEEVKDADDKK